MTRLDDISALVDLVKDSPDGLMGIKSAVAQEVVLILANGNGGNGVSPHY